MDQPLPIPLTADQAAALRLMVSELRQLQFTYQSTHQQLEAARSHVAMLEGDLNEVWSRAQKLQEVGLALGVDVFRASEAAVSESEAVGTKPITSVTGASPEPEFSPKKFVLEEAARAAPKPVRAAQLNQKLKAMGRDVHPKTVGMSLYRWLQQGFLRREGRDWYYVREAERTANATTTDNEGGELDFA